MRKSEPGTRTQCNPAGDLAVMSQYEVAELLGVSRTRVYQIEKQALEKIRQGVLDDPVLLEIAISIGCEIEQPES